MALRRTAWVKAVACKGNAMQVMHRHGRGVHFMHEKRSFRQLCRRYQVLRAAGNMAAQWCKN